MINEDQRNRPKRKISPFFHLPILYRANNKRRKCKKFKKNMSPRKCQRFALYPRSHFGLEILDFPAFLIFVIAICIKKSQYRYSEVQRVT